MVQVATLQEWERLAGGAERAAAVLFWAAWCIPSRTAVENLEALERHYQGRLAFGLVDVDRNAGLAAQQQVKGLPTLLVLKGGATRDRRVGLMSRDALMRLLDRHA